jgi:hypothetical protein
MLRLVGTEQPSAIFLDTLRNLIAVRAVQLKGWPCSGPGGDTGKDDRAPLIGRVEGGRVEIIPDVALAAVQGSLRAQGRPELAITTETLLEQFVTEGKLLDPNGETLRPQDKGRRVFQKRILGKGSRTYVAAFPKDILGIDEENYPLGPFGETD